MKPQSQTGLPAAHTLSDHTMQTCRKKIIINLYYKRKLPGKEKKTPGKGSKTPSASDRFIPNRASTQFELGHYLLTNQKVDENDASAKSDPQKEYQQAMNENLNGDAMQNKIISYRPKPPSAPEGM